MRDFSHGNTVGGSRQEVSRRHFKWEVAVVAVTGAAAAAVAVSGNERLHRQGRLFSTTT